MTVTLYLTGQNNFGNRGCEALVRSTVLAVRSVLPDARFLVPSIEPALDAQQWPDREASGVELVPAPRVPWRINKWGGLCVRVPALAALPWPSLSPDSDDGRHIARADMVLSIGGDNYSLDYGVASLGYFVAVAELARRMGKPVALWGASVGPFSRMPAVERHMVKHLGRLSFVSVRESRSFEYLQGIDAGGNVVAVQDTAFLMRPEPVDLAPFWPALADVGGVLGLNIGALIGERHADAGNGDALLNAIVAFSERVVRETDLCLLLLPHVAPLSGRVDNNDEVFNRRVADRLVHLPAARWSSVPGGFNAAQLKFVVSKLRYLIAARTHATIAAFSTGVPTVSIAYSVKAKGLNRDLFGDERLVVSGQQLDETVLWQCLGRLRAEEVGLLEHYRVHLPVWKQQALAGTVPLAAALAH